MKVLNLIKQSTNPVNNIKSGVCFGKHSYPGQFFSTEINGEEEIVGILWGDIKDAILDPRYDRYIRIKLKGEDYTVTFTSQDPSQISLWFVSPLQPPVILTLFSSQKGDGVYRVRCNGRDLKVRYDEEKGLLSEEDFELLSSEYPNHKFMVVEGIDNKHTPHYPANYTQKQNYNYL